jgi:hypothetical protein
MLGGMASPDGSRVAVIRIWHHGDTTIGRITVADVDDDPYRSTFRQVVGEDRIVAWLRAWLTDTS